jgi:hypothetical protein
VGWTLAMGGRLVGTASAIGRKRRLMRLAETTAVQAVPPASAVTSVNCAEPENTAMEARTGAACPHPLSTATDPKVTASTKAGAARPAPRRMPAL